MAAGSALLAIWLPSPLAEPDQRAPNQRQIAQRQNARKQAKSVAGDCHQLP